MHAGTGADVTITIRGKEDFSVSTSCNIQACSPSDHVQRSICDLLRQTHVSGNPGGQPFHVYGAAVQPEKLPKKDKKDKKDKKKDKKKSTLGFLHRDSSSSDSSDCLLYTSPSPRD